MHAGCRKISRDRSCLRRVPLARFVRLGNAGANSFRLTGRLHGHGLAPGSYLLSATPRSGLGAHGARTAGFQILR
jgi:hypothetical protein